MGKKTLYVIGNGFDLHHKLKSSYKNFYEFVINNKSKIVDFLESYFVFNPKSNEDNDGDYSWCDFENDLASFKAMLFYHDHDNVSEGFLEQEHPSWSDYSGVEDEIREEVDKQYSKIKEVFGNWISSISLTETKAKNMHFDKSAIFLSFNYTSTLEKVYNIPNVFHIHGCVDDGNNLILGHGCEVSKGEIPEFDENGESSRVPSSDAETAAHALFYLFRKPVKEIINSHKDFFVSLQDVEKVIVLGHSLNEIDMLYIHKIKESISVNSSWMIVYYKDKDEYKKRAEEVMSSMGYDSNQYELLVWDMYESIR